MSIQTRKQTFQSREEAAKAKLDSAHYRILLCLLYGSGAENEQLWDDSYIPEIEHALSTIDERESTILRARLLGGKLEEVARLFNTKEFRIRHFEAKALRKLRHHSRPKLYLHLRRRACKFTKVRQHIKRCFYCDAPANPELKFIPCPVRIARLAQQAFESSAQPASA
jgi:DNA-binding CsgD family transcriptional regulator